MSALDELRTELNHPNNQDMPIESIKDVLNPLLDRAETEMSSGSLPLITFTYADLVRRSSSDPAYEPNEDWDPVTDAFFKLCHVMAGDILFLEDAIVTETFNDSLFSSGSPGTVMQIVDDQNSKTLASVTGTERTFLGEISPSGFAKGNQPDSNSTFGNQISFYVLREQDVWFYMSEMALDGTTGAMTVRLTVRSP